MRLHAYRTKKKKGGVGSHRAQDHFEFLARTAGMSALRKGELGGRPRGLKQLQEATTEEGGKASTQVESDEHALRDGGEMGFYADLEKHKRSRYRRNKENENSFSLLKPAGEERKRGRKVGVRTASPQK